MLNPNKIELIFDRFINDVLEKVNDKVEYEWHFTFDGRKIYIYLNRTGDYKYIIKVFTRIPFRLDFELYEAISNNETKHLLTGYYTTAVMFEED